LGFNEKGQKMNMSLIIGLFMGLIFLLIFITQFFSLQKEVKKLKSITNHLLKEIKNLKDNNVR
tara:strand:- start:137 stop:325 length:189 start_codon:yes stop_codon:yes gene_type:complete